MRICFLSRRYFPAISGMSVYAENLLGELVRAGHDVVMVSQYREDDRGVRIYGGGPPPAVPGVEVVGLRSHGEERVNEGEPADFEGDIAAMVAAVEAAHAEKPFDIIHAQYAYPTGLAGMEASRRLRVPNLVSIQGGDGHWVGLCCQTHKAAMLAVLGHAGRLLIGSRSFAREVEEHHGTPQDRFTIVPGATSTERFRPRQGMDLGEVREPCRLLFHGRVDRRKGTFELVDAVAMLLAEGRRLRLIVSGIGPDLEATRERAHAAGIADNVLMPGYAGYDEAPGVYHRGDVFVSPTYSEGFSNTILEAMASGLPIVSTDTVGVVDCLRHEDNGLLVPPRDVESLAAALRRVLDDHALRRGLAQRALADVRENYSWRTVGRQIMAVYDELRGSGVDADWTALYDPRLATLASADLACRYRAEPHLL